MGIRSLKPSIKDILDSIILLAGELRDTSLDDLDDVAFGRLRDHLLDADESVCGALDYVSLPLVDQK